MPLKGNYVPAPPAPQEEESSFLSKLGRLAGPGAVRAVGGALSAPGGWLGAGISAGAEGIAETIENVGDIPAAIRAIPDVARGLSDPKTRSRTAGGFIEGAQRPVARIGAEAALGAIPFGAILKEGRAISSATRGAIHAGSGEALREVTRGEEVDPLSVGIAAGTGGLITGGLAKFLGKNAPKSAGPKYQIETTAVPGGRTLDETGKKLTNVRPISTPRPIRPPVEELAKPDFAMSESELSKALSGLGGGKPKVPYGRQEPAPYRAAAKAGVKAEERATIDAFKAQQELARAEKIAEGREGMVASPPSISESISAKTAEGGTERMTTRFKTPDEEDGGDFSALGDVLSGGPKPKPRAPKPDIGVPFDEIDEIAQTPEDLYQAWRTRTGLSDSPSTRNQFPWEAAGGKATVRGEQIADPTDTAAGLGARVAPEAQGAGPVTTDSIARAKAAAAAERAAYDAGRAPGGQAATAGGGVTRGVDPTAPVVIPELVDDFRPAPEPVADVFENLANAATPVGRGRSQGAIPKLAAPQAEAADTANLERLGTAGGHGLGLEGEPSPIAKFFKTRAGAAGKGYGDIQKALKAGEQIPDEAVQAARNSRLEESAALRGEQGLGPRVPKAAPSPEQGRAIPPELQAPAPEVGISAAPDWVTDQLSMIDRLKKLGSSGGGPGGGETGAVDPAFLAMLGRTGVGAAVGGIAGGAVGHPFMGMAAGGAMGAFGPQAMRSIEDMPQTLQGLQDKFTAEGAHDTAQKIAEAAAQWQRAALLTDPIGLPINSFLAPYGSAVMGAIEHGLSGNPEGWTALKMLTPERFAREYGPAFQEAKGLIGRAEGHPFAAAQNAWEKTVAAPGVVMTGGDVASRNILQDAGIGDDAARRITLTNEPDQALFKWFTNLGKGKQDITSAIGQGMAPFRRTPANVAEQGLQRTPGAGFLFHGEAQQDPMRQMLVQQGMGGAAMGAGGVMGANTDPNEGRVARRAASNALGGYGLPFNIGYGVGQASRADRPSLPAALGAIDDSMPLPTTSTFRDWANFIGGEGRLPRGVVPPTVRDLAFPAENAGSTTGGLDPLPGVPSLRSLRGQ